MAGAGFKTFATGEVLTAANVNTYLMQQTVMVFDDATARTTALGANVSEGMLSYLKDTNQVEVYNGSSWVASDDPNAIQNTIVDAKGDLISATAADTPARIAVGADGTYLQADSSTATGLKWGTVSAGAYTLLSTTTLSGTSTTVSSISQGYKHLRIWVYDYDLSANDRMRFRLNGSSTGHTSAGVSVRATAIYQVYNGDIRPSFGYDVSSNASKVNNFVLDVYNYSDTAQHKLWDLTCSWNDDGTGVAAGGMKGNYESTSAVSSVEITTQNGTTTLTGTMKIYGVN